MWGEGKGHLTSIFTMTSSILPPTFPPPLLPPLLSSPLLSSTCSVMVTSFKDLKKHKLFNPIPPILHRVSSCPTRGSGGGGGGGGRDEGWEGRGGMRGGKGGEG